MWFLTIFAYIVLTVALIGFSLANVGQVVPEIVLWPWGTRLAIQEVPLAHAVLAAFLLGVLLMLVASVGRDVSLRQRWRRERRRRLEIERELAAIRHLPLEEPFPPVPRRARGD